jgi:hypothetical protein
VAFRSIAWSFTNLQALLKESVPSYNLLSELLLKHKSHSHSSFLPELLLMITPTNTSSITITKQTKHIKDKAEVITITEVSGGSFRSNSNFRDNNGFRGGRGSNRYGLFTHQKKCYICNQPGCWSTKHTPKKQKQAYNKFN